VRRDSTFLLHNRLYEAPPQLAGQTIEARFDPLVTQCRSHFFLKGGRVVWLGPKKPEQTSLYPL
jgi:hypothetical protein